MKRTILLILMVSRALYGDANLPKFDGENFTISLPNGFKMLTTAQGKHDASEGSVPFFTAWNDKNHVITGFYDWNSIALPEQIPAVVELLKEHPVSSTARTVASGMVDDGKGGRVWGMVEFDDDGAVKMHMQHTIILLTSVDKSLFRVLPGGPRLEREELVKEANEFLTKFVRKENP